MATVINLSPHYFPTGETYEDRYRGYLEVFKGIAQTDWKEEIYVDDSPWSWVPLLFYLDCSVKLPRVEFQEDVICQRLFRNWIWSKGARRSDYEVLCSFRPETVDALWKIDNQWDVKRGIERPLEKEFVVTNNASFFRPEIKEYLEAFSKYVPAKKNVVLVPCSASKPYPSSIHSAVLERMPKDYYLMNVTGTLGLIPQDLWDIMPHYDAGIPFHWRVFTMVKEYFTRFPHDRIVVYDDFYSQVVKDALRLSGSANSKITYVIDVDFYPDYLDLTDSQRLRALEMAFK